MTLYTASPKLKAVKASIITTTDPQLVARIILKNAAGLNNLIPKCTNATNDMQYVTIYIKNSMAPGKKNSFDVHHVQEKLDFSRNMMISAYEQVDLIGSACAQFASLLPYEKIVEAQQDLQRQLDVIYNTVQITPSMEDIKTYLWSYDQVEDDQDIQKYGSYLLAETYDSIHKYIYLIDLYKKIANHPCASSSFINGVLNYISNQQLRQNIPGNQTGRNRFRA